MAFKTRPVLGSNVNVYLKTTETCNLNCSHCFTSGSRGRRIFFKPEKVISFFERLKKKCPWVESVRFLFHGGEPLLAPLDDLYRAYAGLKDLFKKTSFGIQTNLVYSLTDRHREFMKKVFLRDGFGTSWDYDIRFGSNIKNNEVARLKQIKLWEKNVNTLIHEDSHYMTMIVSVTRRLVREKEPIEVIQYARDLGFQNILFERITEDGNAQVNEEILPPNREQDEWFYKMFLQSFEYETWDFIGNMFMSELATAYVFHRHSGNRCRHCEQSLLTVNADGSLAGCPNSAPVSAWGNIDWSVEENLCSEKRIKAIGCEAFSRNPKCYECPAFDYCNSDCQKLRWDEENSYCAAPKKIWKHMIEEKDPEKYKKLIIGLSESLPHGI